MTKPLKLDELMREIDAALRYAAESSLPDLAVLPRLL